MKLGIIAALSTELKATLQALPPQKSPVVQGLACHECPPFVFAASGVGARPAAAATLLLADAQRPEAILSVGFCGALTDDHKTGDLILGGTGGHPATPAILDLLRSAAPQAKVGELAMVPKVVTDFDEKRSIWKKTGALAIDMESGAVAVAAKERGLGFACVKVVIDTPSDPLASTYAGCLSVLKDVLLRPGTLLLMAYDSKRVKLASERLRDFFLALKDKLPAS